MKKLFKAGLVAVLAGLLAVSLSSCLVVLDTDLEDYDGDPAAYSYSRGTVQILNCDPDRSAYIKTVEYWSENTNSWVECWSYSCGSTDSNINFNVKTGYHDFRITVIYPLYDGHQDYYDTFTTDFNDPVYVSSSYTQILKFDGSVLYEQ